MKSPNMRALGQYEHEAVLENMEKPGMLQERKGFSVDTNTGGRSGRQGQGEN